MDTEKEKIVNSIVKGIAYAENGGKPNLQNPSAGKSGEMKSIFQFTPDTWKAYSKEVTGRDDIPLDADHETYVVQQKVKKWIDSGHTANQIASMWNAGEGNPDAYAKNHKGVNKYGVEYDTPAYAKKVLEYSKKFYAGQDVDAPKPSPKNTKALSTLMSIVQSAKQNTQPKNVAVAPTTQPGMINNL